MDKKKQTYRINIVCQVCHTHTKQKKTKLGWVCLKCSVLQTKEG